MPRAANHAITSGTMRAAGSLRGLDIMPTVSMVAGAVGLAFCIKQEFAIAFRAENRAVHDRGVKSESLDRGADARTSGQVNRGISNDASFTHVASAGLELRFHQDHHFTTRRQQWHDGGNQKR